MKNVNIKERCLRLATEINIKKKCLELAVETLERSYGHDP